MLSVSKDWRKRGIGSSLITLHSLLIIASRFPVSLSPLTILLVTASTLVRHSIEAMKDHGVEEVRYLFFPPYSFPNGMDFR
jgi:hypothetical protein